MCAEYTAGPPVQLESLLEATGLMKRYYFSEPKKRVYPRGQAPIIFRNAEKKYEMVSAEFSLIPPWWNPDRAEKKTKSNRPVFATHNARLETIESKPTFKDSFKRRHCVVPMTEFFESSLFGNLFPGHRIRITHRDPLVAAGCFSEWLDRGTGEIIHSFTIVTSIPSQSIFDAGHDRQPVFLDPANAKAWLDMEEVDPEIQKRFLIQSNLRTTIDFKIEIDRALKAGWEKNSPSPAEIEELRARC